MEDGLARELFGRDAELAVVVDALANDRPVALTGEAGIGKTSLARASIAAAGRRGFEGGGFATLASLPYLALRRASGRPLSGDPATVAAELEHVVGPDVLFIDDLQWTDRQTRLVVERMAKRVALVVAIRTGDPAAAQARSLAERIGAVPVHLRPLGENDLRTLAMRLQPQLSQAAVAEAIRQSGGNPFLLGEIALHGRGSPSFARLITSQLDALGAAQRQHVELLALADEPIPATILGSDVAALVDSGIVEPVADGIRLRHALIAEAVVAGLSAERTVELHRRVASIVTDPTRQARHLAAAGDRQAAAALALSAVETADEPNDRAALLSIAAASLDGDDATRAAIGAAEALMAVGDASGGVALLEPMTARETGLAAMRAAVLANCLYLVGRNEAGWDVIRAARRDPPSPGSRAAEELAITEATALVNTGGQYDRAIGLLEETLRDVGADRASYRLRGILATQRLFAGRTTDTHDLEVAFEDSVLARDGRTATSFAVNLHYALQMSRGGGPAVRFVLDAADRIAAIGFPGRAVELRAEACQVSLFSGDLRGTVLLADGATEAPLGLRPRQRALYIRAIALALMGRFEEAAVTLDDVQEFATDDFDGLGWTWFARAELAYWSGSPDEVRDLVDRAILLPALSSHEYVLPTLTSAWAALALGQPIPVLPETNLSRVLAGAAPEHAGIVALAEDDLATALPAFDAAAEAWAGFHVTRAPMCRWAAGEVARRAGQTADAIDRLEAALEQADGLGMEPLAGRARRSLRLAGRRVHHRSGPRAPDALLTVREREVVELAGRGLTNEAIARRMSLGRPTVARLLANAMGKLGASSRIHAAVLAHDLGPARAPERV